MPTALRIFNPHMVALDDGFKITPSFLLQRLESTDTKLIVMGHRCSRRACALASQVFKPLAEY